LTVDGFTNAMKICGLCLSTFGNKLAIGLMLLAIFLLKVDEPPED